MLKNWEILRQTPSFTCSLGLPTIFVALLGTLTLSCTSGPTVVSPEPHLTGEKMPPAAAVAPVSKDKSDVKKSPVAENTQNAGAPHQNISSEQKGPSNTSHGGNDTSPAMQKSSPLQEAELASLRIEVMSLKEKMASLQRKLDVVLKAQRSGLLEYEGIESARSAFEKIENKRSSLPPLGNQGPLDRFENDFENDSRERLKTPESLQKLLDRAVTSMAQRDFGRVVQSLEDYQSRFPNNPLSNIAELLLAEAYVELKSPHLALPHLRAFYLQHPNDPQLHKAKWLEAQTQEQLRASQKAAQLYREVIALAPDSELALRSRASLERLSGSLQ